jgi:hypothetical protein
MCKSKFLCVPGLRFLNAMLVSPMYPQIIWASRHTYIEQLARVKAVIPETVLPDGYAILKRRR